MHILDLLDRCVAWSVLYGILLICANADQLFQ